MRSLVALVALGSLLAGSSGCVLDLGKSLHQVSLLEVTDLAGATRVRPVEVQREQTVIFYFAFDADYADEARRDLLAACPRGRVVNITARHSTDLGFFAHRNKLLLRGYCLE